MKTHLNFAGLLLLAITFLSCKKDKIEIPVKPVYIQYFNANIAGKDLNIKGSLGENRGVFRGSWTVLGYGNGTDKDLYRVDVAIPNRISNSSSAQLSFQIFDIKQKPYTISSARAYLESFSSNIYLIVKSSTSSYVYTTSELKKPFVVNITKYEKPKDGSLPFVGGKIDGVLYNTKNLQDSIVIRDGVFEVRF